jgi:hypothetical protein
LKTAAGTREESSAAEYKTITKQVLKSAAGTKEEVIPGEYKTVTKQVTLYGRGILKADGKTIVDLDGNGNERVIGKYCGANGTYSSKEGAGNAPNGPTGADICIYPAYKEDVTPAQYSTVTKQVTKAAATTREENIPAEYKTITKQVVKTAATTREENIPAQYETKSKQVVKSAASTREIDIPAEYTTITKRKLTKQGGVTEWREVLCDTKVTQYTIRTIQGALRSRGYDPGPEDNVMGTRTKAALVQFQKDKGLPTGNLNIETLKALGVQY